MLFRKYTLKPAKWEQLKELATNCTIVELGHIALSPAVMEGDTVKKPAVISPDWHVDILWEQAPPKEFKPFEVWPDGLGAHVFAGFEEQYKRDRDELRK